jgi:hypothetical protein
MHACMYLCTYECIYVRMHVCMYVCMYVCMHVCMSPEPLVVPSAPTCNRKKPLKGVDSCSRVTFAAYLSPAPLCRKVVLLGLVGVPSPWMLSCTKGIIPCCVWNTSVHVYVSTASQSNCFTWVTLISPMSGISSCRSTSKKHTCCLIYVVSWVTQTCTCWAYCWCCLICIGRCCCCWHMYVCRCCKVMLRTVNCYYCVNLIRRYCYWSRLCRQWQTLKKEVPGCNDDGRADCNPDHFVSHLAVGQTTQPRGVPQSRQCCAHLSARTSRATSDCTIVDMYTYEALLV